jgi:hypothetical protein
MKRVLAIASLALLPLVAVSDSAPLTSSFLGAPAGMDEAFSPVALPPLRASFSARLAGTAALPGSPFEPSLQALLAGETVITSAAQMRAVWARLFDAPYDPALFDFGTDFVVWMGGGVLPPGATFDVSSVESCAGNYSNAGGLGGPTEDDPFLCVTATTFLPGVLPAEPPPASYLVSAVRVSRTLLDDVVFHRTTILGI